MSEFMCPLAGCGFMYRGQEAIAIEEMGICTRCQGVFRKDAKPAAATLKLQVEFRDVELGVSL